MFRLFYQLFILLFLFSFSFLIEAGQINISPLDKKIITNGDMVYVQISASESLSWSDLNLKNIGDIFYILEIEGKAETLAEAKVLVVPPSNPKYDGKLKIGDKSYQIKLNGFEPSWKKDEPIQDYLTVITNHQLSEHKLYKVALILFGIFALMLGFKNKVKLYFQKRKKLKILKKNRTELMNQLNAVKSREDLEQVYLIKSRIQDLYSVEDSSYKQFVRHMNAIQYKPEWTLEELTLAQKALTSMKNNLREKRGV